MSTLSTSGCRARDAPLGPTRLDGRRQRVRHHVRDACTAYSFTAFFAPLQKTFGASRGEFPSLPINVPLVYLLGGISGPLATVRCARDLPFRVVVGGCGLIFAASATALWQAYVGFGLCLGWDRFRRRALGWRRARLVRDPSRSRLRRRRVRHRFCTLLMPLLATPLIALMDWRGAWLIFGLLILVAGGAASFFISNTPEKYGALPDGGVIGLGAKRTLDTPPRSRGVRVKQHDGRDVTDSRRLKPGGRSGVRLAPRPITPPSGKRPVFFRCVADEEAGRAAGNKDQKTKISQAPRQSIKAINGVARSGIEQRAKTDAGHGDAGGETATGHEPALHGANRGHEGETGSHPETQAEPDIGLPKRGGWTRANINPQPPTTTPKGRSRAHRTGRPAGR